MHATAYTDALDRLLGAESKADLPLDFFPSRPLREVPPEDLRPWPFPPFLDNPGCAWLQTLKRLYARPVSFPASLSPDAGLLLHSLVRNIQPSTIVETGTFLGISTIWMGAALADLGGPTAGRTLHSFDAYLPIEPGPWRVVGMGPERPAFVEHHVADAQLSGLVCLHRGWSAPEIRALRGAGEIGPVQLAFLDADHSEQGVVDDFLAVAPLVPTGGYVVLHDTHPHLCGCVGPRRLMDTINQYEAGRYTLVDVFLAPVNYGLCVMQRVG